MKIESSKINVFPSVKRAQGSSTYNTSRIMGESGIVGITKHIVRNQSYVITDEFSVDTSNQGYLEIVIDGYYFNFYIITTNLPDSDNIYATIDIDSTVASYPELKSSDAIEGSVSYYSGLVISGTKSDTNCLLILTRSVTSGSYTYSIPDSSKCKFSMKDINILDTDVIDGGIVG